VLCQECGFVYEDVAPGDIAGRLRSFPNLFASRLGAPAFAIPGVDVRPSPLVWSTLEYACHVRDVVIAQRERVLLTLVEDRPGFAPIYRDQRAVLAAYAAEPPERVAVGMKCAAVLLAHVFERLTPEQLSRPCVYNYPEPAQRDVLWIGRRTVHECHHHLLDIDRR
jgi:S-DNA-T family DNA segregation ATPase FtsK/SpoIIIE